jgi:putative phosphoribosyl transferase
MSANSTVESGGGVSEERVQIVSDNIRLNGDLIVPAGAKGVVVFAHGSGSSRFSPRNRYVASALREGGLGTLLMDLLSVQEEQMDERTGYLRFDIELLSERLVSATDWLKQHEPSRHLKIGYFGASTGAGAALVAAALRPDDVGAVVSRGGRPDLAGPALRELRAPTLLIVGGNDIPVITLNQQAINLMNTTRRMEIVPGASHLFEEPGTLEQVARLAREWFERYLV